MTGAFGRRLLLLTAIEIAGILCAVVLGVALFAFGSYVTALASEVDATNDQLALQLRGTPGTRDAVAAGRAAAPFVRGDLLVVAFDSKTRVSLYRPRPLQPVSMRAVRARGDLSGDPHAASPLARPILGLAYAFGLKNARLHLGAVDVIVRANEQVVTDAVERFVPALVFALFASIVAGYAFARVLTRQALRPLVEVTAALERFAGGASTPQPIAADRRHELGRLAIAYNDAIVQMQHAFAERERANDAMRRFIADAGHQLRTPLTVVRGFIAILRKGELRRPEDRERILATMNQQSLLMASMIDKLMLLDHWESEGATAEPIDVAQLIDDVISPIAEANPSRTVRVAGQPGALVAIDPSDLMHAATNVVDNALKYTTGAVDVRVIDAGATVRIEVSDEGPGMDASELSGAFDRFHRGERRRHVEGSGLGLTIARRAVERAGGTLAVESDVAQGSRFTFTFPKAARIADAPAALAAPVTFEAPASGADASVRPAEARSA